MLSFFLLSFGQRDGETKRQTDTYKTICADLSMRGFKNKHILINGLTPTISICHGANKLPVYR